MPRRKKDPLVIERKINDFKRKIIDENPSTIIRFM